MGVSLRRPILPPTRRRVEAARENSQPLPKGKAARALQTIGVFSLFAMAGRDDEAILVIRDREVAMHLLDLRDRETGLRKNAPPVTLAKLTLTEIDTHREHPLKGRNDWRVGTGGQKIGEIADRIRSDQTSGISPTVSIPPALACDWIGDSGGGTYQTIGRVRYSGWSGKAIFQSTAIL